MDHEQRLLRIARALDSVAKDEVTDLIEDIAEGPLGEVERQVNRAILALDGRLQERLLFSVGPVVVFRWRNTEGWPVEYVSENVQALTGYTAAEYLSRAKIYAGHIPEEDLPQVMEEVQRYSASGVDWFEHLPYRLNRSDGRIIWVSDHTVILRDRDGKITHYFGYLSDCTERLEQSRKLAQREKTLEKIATPVLSVWDGVLAVPVLGALDEERASEMTGKLLSAVSGGGVSHCILDLTGMEAIDASTMEHVARLISAVSLLGASCLVSGISPETARVIVSLGLDLSRVKTFGTLRAALSFALGRARAR